jgi:hypothetical protein
LAISVSVLNTCDSSYLQVCSERGVIMIMIMITEL